MKELASDSTLTEVTDESDESGIQLFQLVLEYILDSQSALARLFQMEQLLFQILGIEPLSSFNVNLERAAYALGSDDLNDILSQLTS